MKIAIDLDNTLIDHNRSFIKAYQEIVGNTDKDLPNSPKNKMEIKLAIMKDENLWPNTWIKIQGRVYGELIEQAQLFVNAQNTITKLLEQGNRLEIVSHKSQLSFCKKYKLQEKAIEFLKKNNINIKTNFFETFEEKINYIKSNDFDAVIDDLEKVINQLDDITPLRIHFQNKSELFHTDNWSIIAEIFTQLRAYYKSSFKTVRKTRNSIILKGNKSIFFKVLKHPERTLREVWALKALDKLKLTPSLISYTENTIATNFIKFNALTKIEESFIDDFSEIIDQLRINQDSHSASHRVKSINDVNTNIESRLKKISHPEIKSRIQHCFNIVKAKTTDFKSYQDVCYPDLYKRNFGWVKDHHIIFDFESCGLDDPSRSFLNFTHHTEQGFTIDELDVIIRTFKKTYQQDANLFDRVLNIFDSIALEWIIIFYNYSKNKEPAIKLLSTFENNIKDNKECFSWQQEAYERIKRQVSGN